mgnify:CR=1 FL=1
MYETNLRERLRLQILNRMDLSRDLEDEEIKELIRQEIVALGREQNLTLTERLQLEREGFNSLRKLDILQDLLDEDEKLSFNETKESINLDSYEITGKCRDKRDAACFAKFSDADAIYPLIRNKKMSKAEWLTDFIVAPGIIQGADYLDDMSTYYLVEIGEKQMLVKVTSEFIITSELANKVNPKKFEFGKYTFKKATYQLI